MSLLPFLAVLARQRLDVLERRRLERLEAVAPIHVLDDADDVIATPDVFRKEIPHAAGRASLLRSHQRVDGQEEDDRGIRGS